MNLTQGINGRMSRLSSPPFSTKKHGTYEPSDFQIMKIENNLGRMCKDLALDDSVSQSYRAQIITWNMEEHKQIKKLSYLEKIKLDNTN